MELEEIGAAELARWAKYGIGSAAQAAESVAAWRAMLAQAEKFSADRGLEMPAITRFDTWCVVRSPQEGSWGTDYTFHIQPDREITFSRSVIVPLDARPDGGSGYGRNT